MSGRQKFSELEASLTPRRRARIDRLSAGLGQEIDIVQSGTEPQLSQAVLQLLREHPDGLTPAEIREKLGVQQNKAAERSIVSVLAALSKNSQVSPRDRKYVSA